MTREEKRLKKICVMLLVLALMLSGCGKEAAAEQLLLAGLEGQWTAVAGGTVTITNVTENGFDIKIDSGCETEVFRVYKGMVREDGDYVTMQYLCGALSFSAGSYDDLEGEGKISVTVYDDVQEKAYPTGLSSEDSPMKTFVYNVEITFTVINRSGLGYSAYAGAVLLLIEQ